MQIECFQQETTVFKLYLIKFSYFLDEFGFEFAYSANTLKYTTTNVPFIVRVALSTQEPTSKLDNPVFFDCRITTDASRFSYKNIYSDPIMVNLYTVQQEENSIYTDIFNGKKNKEK